MDYGSVITIATVCIAFLTNGRIAYVLAGRWGFDQSGNHPPIWEGFSAVVGSVVFYFLSCAAFDYYGMMGCVICMFLTLPLSGLIWIFLVGGNKAIERILNSLMKRL